MAEPFLAEIRLFSFNQIPRGWLPCDGRLLSIVQYQALFALIGTIYGGDGTTTFALPDLQGRVPVHAATGSLPIGTRDGSATQALAVAEIPAHTHTARAASSTAGAFTPVGNVWGVGYEDGKPYAASSSGTMDPTALSNTGGQAHQNLQPSLGLSFCIATAGQWPPRP